MAIKARLASLRRRRGFTAIEVSAVATIIAILALILIPIMRGRVDEAKRVAATEDMTGIEKAETLAFADTGHYFRVQDLGRPKADQDILRTTAGTPTDPNRLRELARIPQAFWNVEVQPGQVGALAATWTGPQASVHNYLPLTTLQSTSPWLFSDGTASGGGPILFLGNNGQDDIDSSNLGGLGEIRYPVDPWGNPYIFYGPGPQSAPSGTRGLHFFSGNVTETNFGTAVVYSLGPDGLPGVGVPANQSSTYYRSSGRLGMPGSDDLVREF